MVARRGIHFGCHSMYDYYAQYCEGQAAKGRLRILPQISVPPQADFSSNDYLGLSREPALLRAAIAAAEQVGTGATGSRLLSGSSELLAAFEQRIASDKGTEAALVFCSGYQANLTVLASLMHRRVLPQAPQVFFDRLNHSSLYNGVLLAGAECILFEHNDMQDLQDKLHALRDPSRPAFIVAETVHGMDGDVLDIERVAALAASHQCFVYLDEAHATGLYGPRGFGVSTQVDLSGVPHIIMGTFSKALGGAGAYVACSDVMKQFLINRTAGFIYSTAPSPMTVGAAQAAWQRLPSMDRQRQRVFSLAASLRERLRQLGFQVLGDGTNIVPVCLGAEAQTMALKQSLLQQGVLVSAIRPPTVPTGTSRLRIAVTAHHDEAIIGRLVEGMAAGMTATVEAGHR